MHVLLIGVDHKRGQLVWPLPLRPCQRSRRPCPRVRAGNSSGWLSALSSACAVRTFEQMARRLIGGVAVCEVHHNRRHSLRVRVGRGLLAHGVRGRSRHRVGVASINAQDSLGCSGGVLMPHACQAPPKQPARHAGNTLPMGQSDPRICGGPDDGGHSIARDPVVSVKGRTACRSSPQRKYSRNSEIRRVLCTTARGSRS